MHHLTICIALIYLAGGKICNQFCNTLLFSSSTRWLGNRIVKWNLDKFEIEKNVTFLIQKKISLKIEKMCTLLPSLLWKNNEWIQLPIETFLNWQFNWVELQFNKFQWVYCSNSSMMCLKAKKKSFCHWASYYTIFHLWHQLCQFGYWVSTYSIRNYVVYKIDHIRRNFSCIFKFRQILI